MKRSFTSITAAWRNSLAAALLLASLGLPAGRQAAGFQTEEPQGPAFAQAAFERLEGGRLVKGKDPEALFALQAGEYERALQLLTPAVERDFPWLRDYLIGTIQASKDLVKIESAHFVLYAPPGQEFLADYALPALERAGDYFEEAFGRRPAEKIRVEIYPDKERFSVASTLSDETLERSGAIGICKFHRLMILSPQALPLGYRWMDALTHEYIHLMVNELSATRAELWLHEGTARYFETAPRVDPPSYLTPHQQTALLDALEKKELVPFSKMSPSMVYLKDQQQVTLAFAEVSHAVDLLVREKGVKVYRQFLEALSKAPFARAFERSFGLSPAAFEEKWKKALGKEKWERAKGAMSDEVQFVVSSPEEMVGADAQARLRLGDQMRMRGHNEAALIEYEKALQEEPDNAVLLLKIARTKLGAGDKASARPFLVRAVEKNPNYATPRIELAALSQDAEALIHLQEANAINPFDPRVHMMMAEIYFRRGDAAKGARESAIASSLGG